MVAQEAYEARDKFCEVQHPRQEKLWRIVREHRLRRKQVRLLSKELALMCPLPVSGGDPVGLSRV